MPVAISSYAFFQRKVGKIVFPKTLKRFEHSALCNCYIDADELVIPNIEFEDGEWFNATILPPIVKLEGMSALEDGAFAYSTFGAMSLPSTLTEIGDWAFYNCKSITSITIPEGITSIGKYTFSECRQLSSITFPNNLKTIEEGAFEYCQRIWL